MFVLKREVGESFYVGDLVEITIDEIDAGQVKICINAPKEVTILRKEMLENKTINDRRDIAALKQKIKQQSKL